MEQPPVIRLIDSDVRPLAETMARAFLQGPNFVYTQPDEARRRQTLPAMFSCFIRIGQQVGTVYTTDERNGAAIWAAPGRHAGFIDSWRAGFLALPLRLRFSAVVRLGQLGTHLSSKRRALMPEPHWYLMALAVDPYQQGKGLGSHLIRPVLTQADRAGQACYLETFVRQNLHFYEKHGFQTLGKCTLPNGGPTYWTMKRLST
ncbi:GNAT family N-acetyltransferase [Fibrisoma montanum]|nr:GNAT family N-acetyltransferase [Fibrisoma montanum]